MPVVAARAMLTLYVAPAWRYSITTHVVVRWYTIHYSFVCGCVPFGCPRAGGLGA